MAQKRFDGIKVSDPTAFTPGADPVGVPGVPRNPLNQVRKCTSTGNHMLVHVHVHV